jgi:heterodisulfide reductase subunit C2
MMKGLPIMHLMRMGWNMVHTPRTRSWGRTGEVLKAYVQEQKEARHG